MAFLDNKPEIKLIVCPIDFSEFSVRAYDHALSLAEHYRAKLVAQHVVELWQHPSLSFAANGETYEAYCQDLRDDAQKRLQEFLKNHAHDEVQPELSIQQGTAPDSILSFAHDRQADLIVMGLHGRRGLDRLMLGSVTERVMRSAECPVLAVSHPTRESVGEVGEKHHAHHLNRILFCADFSANSNGALDYAISATAEYDAELILLHVLGEEQSPSEMDGMVATVTAQLDELIPRQRRQGLKIKTAVRIGKPYQQIIQLALESEIDLVTMGVRGRGALDLAVFGSTTYRVMQLGFCPVLAVHA